MLKDISICLFGTLFSITIYIMVKISLVKKLWVDVQYLRVYLLNTFLLFY